MDRINNAPATSLFPNSKGRKLVPFVPTRTIRTKYDKYDEYDKYDWEKNPVCRFTCRIRQLADPDK